MHAFVMRPPLLVDYHARIVGGRNVDLVPGRCSNVKRLDVAAYRHLSACTITTSRAMASAPRTRHGRSDDGR